ncbi:MAG: hypothetical protein RIR12_491 [Bacteroidota bacterium]
MSAQKLLSALLSAVMVLLLQVSFAQDRTVTGKVTDSKDGSPVNGATVQAKGARTGTSTKADGTFSISVGSNVSALVISSVGFETQEVAISGSTANVSLVAGAAASLNEVVVTGYGTRKIKDATGSVAAITPKDFNKGQISTPEQLFQGRTPGVTVSPSSGEPGAAATINIRGTSSVRGNQQPLYVVDGVPLDGGATAGTASGMEGNSTAKNPLIFINPNDIESISILKDASAAAIYGARGANGVIIITTKGGKGAKGSWTFGSSTSIASTAKRYDLLSAQDFVKGVYQQNILSGTSPADAAIAVASIDKGGDVDWQDQIFRTAISQNFNIGWGFARNGMSLRVSGSYDNQEGIVKNSGLERKTIRANFSKTFLKNDALKLEITSNYSNIQNQYVANTNNAGFQGSLIGATISFNPTIPVKDPSTGLYSVDGNNRNPAAILAYFDDTDNINRILTNLSLSYKIKDGLVFKTTFGYDNAKGQRKSFADPRLPSAFGGTTNVFGWDYQNSITGNGRGSIQDLKSNTILFENTLTYDKVFGGKHTINAVLGQGYQKSTSEYESQVGWGLTTPPVNATDVFNKNFDAFLNKRAGAVPYYGESTLASYFGRVNYNFDDRYLLTATVRADGSSRFGANNRYGVFPAFAAKWKILNEGFASGLAKIFSDFSVRANYGIIGSQDNIGDYAAVNLTQTWVAGSNGATRTDNINTANPDLKWEQAATTGIGLDWAIKNRRLSGTVDYFHTERKNVVLFTQVPGGFAGVGNWFANLPGIVTNDGLEVSVNLQAVKGKKFTWDVNYNMTFLKNNVEGVPVPINTGQVNGQGLTGAYAQTIRSGYPIFSWVMPVFVRFDAIGNAVYDKGAADQLVGSAIPTFNAGLNNSFTLGRWNASFFVNASTGFYVYNNTANALFLAGSLKTAHNVDYRTLNAGENPINPGSVSTRFLEKGDFLRLSNALIGYDFKVSGKVIKSLNLNLSGQNLLLITNYSGLDPEVNVDKGLNGSPSRGFDYAGYPKARTFTLGLNIGF